MRGLTLIEVLAALAILSTLIAGVLVALGRSQRQWVRAHRQLEAVSAADALIASWWQGKGVPVSASGVLPGEAGMRWQTVPIPSFDAARLYAQVVRLQVYLGEGRSGAAPLVSVDLLRPVRLAADSATTIPVQR
jgi:prepilin-type N-terminal cleavage/methylation domain-containing protein